MWDLTEPTEMVVVGGSTRGFVHHESNVWNFTRVFGNGEIEKGTFTEWNEIVALGGFVFGGSEFENFRAQDRWGYSLNSYGTIFFEILKGNILRNFGR